MMKEIDGNYCYYASDDAFFIFIFYFFKDFEILLDFILLLLQTQTLGAF